MTSIITKLENCAAWNDEAAASAYIEGNEDRAARLWAQAKRIRGYVKATFSVRLAA